MLRNAETLYNLELRARDGVIGKVKDFYFDDRYWTVRYVVVETGTWLNSRRVLIATSVVGEADWSGTMLNVDLTQEQVRHSPGINTTEPVSREQELGLHQHYGWAAYWAGAADSGTGFGSPVGVAGYGAGVPFATDVPVNVAPSIRTAPDGDPRLRSGRAVAGYHIDALDGSIGHVEDYLIDDQSWTISYVIIDTRNWLPGGKVILTPAWIDRVRWSESSVHVQLSCEQVKHAPKYDPGAPVSDDYAGSLHGHYGAPPPRP